MGNVLEQFFGPLFRGTPLTEAQSKNNQFAGRTSVISASVSITVSTFVVNSDSIINFDIHAPSDIASGLARGFEVKSISHGNYFSLGTVDGEPFGRLAGTLMWRIINTSED